MTDEKLADKFDPADKTKLETAVNDTIHWLDASQEGSKEEYEEKQKELEAIANPSCRNSMVVQGLRVGSLMAVLEVSLVASAALQVGFLVLVAKTAQA